MTRYIDGLPVYTPVELTLSESRLMRRAAHDWLLKKQDDLWANATDASPDEAFQVVGRTMDLIKEGKEEPMRRLYASLAPVEGGGRIRELRLLSPEWGAALAASVQALHAAALASDMAHEAGTDIIGHWATKLAYLQ